MDFGIIVNGNWLIDSKNANIIKGIKPWIRSSQCRKNEILQRSVVSTSKLSNPFVFWSNLRVLFLQNNNHPLSSLFSVTLYSLNSFLLTLPFLPYTPPPSMKYFLPNKGEVVMRSSPPTSNWNKHVLNLLYSLPHKILFPLYLRINTVP